MALPKLPSRKQGKDQKGKLVYVGFVTFWIVLAGVAILAFQNFTELWRLSNDHAQTINVVNTPKKSFGGAISPARAEKLKAAAAAKTTKAKATPTTATTTTTTTTEKNPNEIFVAGIMYADKDKYIDALQAEVDTWMSEIPNERIFAVGPSYRIADRKGFPKAVDSPCPSDRTLWCKRVQHIPEAYKLLKSGIHFDWLLSGNEDWYVNLAAMREAFANKDPNDPVVYANMGCSMQWEYQPSSKNGTVPMPPGYKVNPDQQCEGNNKRGGICGGYGIVFSRGAIETMGQVGEEGIFNITRSHPFPWKSAPQGDPVLSCLIYSFEDKGVRMEQKPWKERSAKDILTRKGSAKNIATTHAVTFDEISPADIIRKVHAKVKKDLQE